MSLQNRLRLSALRIRGSVGHVDPAHTNTGDALDPKDPYTEDPNLEGHGNQERSGAWICAESML